MARLKTFILSNGLTDYVVAASSRPKALAAWGAHQDLFKEGLAREIDDPQVVAAAAERPGEVLTRPAGGRAPVVPAAKPEKRRPAGPTPAQQRKAADLQAALSRLDSDFAAQAQARGAAIEALRREEDAARTRYEKDREGLVSRLKRARSALSR